MMFSLIEEQTGGSRSCGTSGNVLLCVEGLSVHPPDVHPVILNYKIKITKKKNNKKKNKQKKNRSMTDYIF